MDVSTQCATTPLDAFRAEHRELYLHVVNDCGDALSSMWSELGFHPSEIKTELSSITANVVQVWHSAVAAAKQQKEALLQEIREVEVEISAIQIQLGEITDASVDSRPSGSASLKQRLEETKQLRNQFLERRQCRISQFKGERMTRLETFISTSLCRYYLENQCNSITI